MSAHFQNNSNKKIDSISKILFKYIYKYINNFFFSVKHLIYALLHIYNRHVKLQHTYKYIYTCMKNLKKFILKDIIIFNNSTTYFLKNIQLKRFISIIFIYSV